MTNKEKRNLPKHCFLRGKKIWFTIKNEVGDWVNKPTPYRVGQEELAGRYVKAMRRGMEDRREKVDAPDSNLLRGYVERWLKDREAREVASAGDERQRLEKYILPELGSFALGDLRPIHVRNLVRKLRSRTGKDKLAPRTVIHIYRVLHNVMETAIADELIFSNPVKLKRGELPKKVDKDPEWRSRATFTVREVERLISDPVVPVERRVMYALKAIAGMRHGEAAALCWRHIDHDAEPLARINIVQSFCSRTHKVKSTKTEETRAVPMHPTLAKILAAWKLEHWERIYGRKPTDDDFVVPARTMNPINAADSGHAMKDDDLPALGMRVEAGKFRKRGGHDLRGWYKTRCIEDGADSLIIRRTTHAPPKDVDGGYERFSWSTMCREVGKLKVSILDGKVLPLLTESLQAEAKASGRWRNLVTPKGLEKDKMRATGRQSTPVSVEKRGAEALTRNQSRTRPVRTVLTAAAMIERAILSGDTARALRIVSELREGEGEPAGETKPDAEVPSGPRLKVV